MNSFTLLRGSVLGLALMAATEQVAPAQSIAGSAEGTAKVSGVTSAGKSEEGASSAIGLSKQQNKLFLELIDTRAKKTAEFRKIEDRTDQRKAGLEINKWWNTVLQEMMDEEQYSRYSEYWMTNTVVIQFDPEDKEKYVVKVSPHPLDVNAKLQASLKLTERQTLKIEAMRAKQAKELRAAQELVKSPDNLPNVNAIVAKQQRERNEYLKEILSEAQYTGYRKSLDQITTSSAAAVMSPSRAAAPVKP